MSYLLQSVDNIEIHNRPTALHQVAALMHRLSRNIHLCIQPCLCEMSPLLCGVLCQILLNLFKKPNFPNPSTSRIPQLPKSPNFPYPPTSRIPQIPQCDVTSSQHCFVLNILFVLRQGDTETELCPPEEERKGLTLSLTDYKENNRQSERLSKVQKNVMQDGHKAGKKNTCGNDLMDEEDEDVTGVLVVGTREEMQ